MNHSSEILEAFKIFDDLMENSQHEKESFSHTMFRLFEKLMVQYDFSEAVLRIFSEFSEEKYFRYEFHGDRVVKSSNIEISTNSNNKQCFPLVFHEEPIGEIFITSKNNSKLSEFQISIIDLFREIIDNYIFNYIQERKKQIIIEQISFHLKDTLLIRGLNKVAEYLHKVFEFSRLILSFDQKGLENEVESHFVCFYNGKFYSNISSCEDPFIHEVKDFMPGICENNDSKLKISLLEKWGEICYVNYFDEGIVSTQKIGMILVSFQEDKVTSLTKDIFNVLSQFIRQRIIDFNREERNLSKFFPRKTIEKILLQENYNKTILMPQNKQFAICYSDISGFTAICEKILITPEKIGKFIDVWSRYVISIIFAHNGVFDKMVGDCSIAFFGPPFFEKSPSDCCREAILTAEEIHQMTLKILTPYKESLEKNGIKNFGTATGIHYCPAFVGLLGANDDYTAFSSGMNNTARLQSNAVCGEILVSPQVKELVEEFSLFKFGPKMSFQAKNVTKPLEYHKVEQKYNEFE